ncbi:hypothetical protein HRR83_007008 [Exophiala dermatitidis]|uniref:Uncharacterized protein n=2 Tax=Exophiala dermatitidis TaxID=5970 RepID=H6BK68_EXODN|nr:uncharacterized protein HMPREF1120_00714 [Exophiala dermatitidis NIH/UT8656]KAJ4512492.1 hypothetical protein HRR73_006047 [Exophiala dermatitidis]EHY52502.1 hypothetical protein HMPREF1120_00714 [Exophiala dermatitidis NIH/UT8656]KAJ4512634.1 hypothetical protein HRR74_006332 [Exophiala dermatitidis]KAJ4542434.1 hypothetical protein HRR77_005636 [Exophiala dermatitidis]KAJ4546630.1 hypothetical protein HRR78_005631 [Exophiala dermatitidis]
MAWSNHHYYQHHHRHPFESIPHTVSTAGRPQSTASMDSDASSSGRSSDHRKSSTTSTASQSSISPISPGLGPKVQLVPYARSASFDVSLSDAERELLDKANFDALDMSSKDFDFEDIFTFDKPQKKLAKVVEVSRPTRDHRDWSNFSFSHYSAAVSARNKVNRSKTGIGELYLRNQFDARRS